jgi:hypothetical protein
MACSGALTSLVLTAAGSFVTNGSASSIFGSAPISGTGIGIPNGLSTLSSSISSISSQTFEKIELLHLNGASKENFKRGKDKHMLILSERDGIWHNNEETLKSLLNICQINNIDIICEINDEPYEDEFKYAMNFLKAA